MFGAALEILQVLQHAALVGLRKEARHVCSLSQIVGHALAMHDLCQALLELSPPPPPDCHSLTKSGSHPVGPHSVELVCCDLAFDANQEVVPVAVALVSWQQVQALCAAKGHGTAVCSCRCEAVRRQRAQSFPYPAAADVSAVRLAGMPAQGREQCHAWRLGRVHAAELPPREAQHRLACRPGTGSSPGAHGCLTCTCRPADAHPLRSRAALWAPAQACMSLAVHTGQAEIVAQR